jgi:hypothetical protein
VPRFAAKDATSQVLKFGPADAFPTRMSVKTGIVVAMVGGLLLHPSGARGAENVLESPHPIGDQPAPGSAGRPIPHSSDAPPASVPGFDPVLEPLMQPAPVPSLTEQPAPAPSLTGPTMIHKPRSGFLVAGVAIALPAYLLQMLSTLAYSPTIQTYDEPCSYCAKAAALTLIPIVGPWLGAREAGTPNDPVALIFGGIEAAAVSMIIVGVVGHDVPAEPEQSKVSLAPFVTPQAGGLSLHMRW